MKPFSTLKDLWEYMLYCPICQGSCRAITMSVGPDDVFSLNNYKINKTDSIKIDGSFNHQTFKTNLIFHIDCKQNTFTIDIKAVEDFKSEKGVYKSDKPYFYFYLYSKCHECDSSEANSADLELNFLQKKIIDIGVEHEVLYVLEDNSGFKIEYQYDENVVHICEYKVLSPTLTLSSLELDFTDKNKLLNKLKTLVLFS